MSEFIGYNENIQRKNISLNAYDSGENLNKC